jgi:hypothetical protein
MFGTVAITTPLRKMSMLFELGVAVGVGVTDGIGVGVALVVAAQYLPPVLR